MHCRRLLLSTMLHQYFDNDASAPRNFVPATGPVVPLQSVYGFTPTAEGYATNVATDGYLERRAGHLIGELVNGLGPATLTTMLACREISFDSTVNFAGSPAGLRLSMGREPRSGRMWRLSRLAS